MNLVALSANVVVFCSGKNRSQAHFHDIIPCSGHVGHSEVPGVGEPSRPGPAHSLPPLHPLQRGQVANA